MKRRSFLETVAMMPALDLADPAGGAPGASFAGSNWRIGSKEMARNFANDSRGLRLLSLKNLQTGFDWALPGRCDFVFHSADLSFRGLGPESGFKLTGQESRTLKKGAEELRLDFEHARLPLRLSLFYTSFPGTVVFEQRCELRNTGGSTIPGITRFDPVLFSVKGEAAKLQVRTIRRSRYALENWPLSDQLEIRGGGWNAPQHAGLIALEDASHREILFFGVRWERDWVVRWEKQDQGIEISAGLTDISHDLAPGGVLRSPAIFTGLTKGDFDGAARQAQHYLTEFVSPPALPDFPWVVYDIWGTEAENVEQMILDEVKFAAELGVELFYIDASWYEGSSKRGTGDWGCGIGVYQDDRQKYPRGLAYISEQVHRSGMKFGLWVDPVVADVRRIGKQIPPSWVGQRDGKDNILTIRDWEAQVAHLCLGNPEFVKSLKADLSRIVKEFNLDWMKWDNSGLPGSPIICNRSDHGHGKGDGSYAAQAGYYEIWEHLHDTYPNLVLEQCGYGSRHDFGVAPYCRAHWLSDATYPAEHVRENAFVASHLYPSAYNGGWMVRSNEIEAKASPGVLDTMYRSRMIGLFGFGTLHGKLATERVSDFPPEVLDAARRNIPLYKRYRHLLNADCYHLTPPVGAPELWQAIEFAARDGSEAVVLVFRARSTQPLYRVRLKGLLPESNYVIASANDKTQAVKAGEKLMSEGVLVKLPAENLSEVLLVKRGETMS